MDPANAPFGGADSVGGPIDPAAIQEVVAQDAAIPVAPADGFYLVDPRLISTDRIGNGIFTLVVFVGAVVGAVVWLLADGLSVPFYCAAALAGVVLLLLLWATFFWPSISYRHIFWRLNDMGLEIRRGVWWKHQIAVPWARVQHADVSQGPLQRMFGLSSLTVHTAGTSDSSITLEGLEHGTALGIRDEIIRQRKLDVV